MWTNALAQESERARNELALKVAQAAGAIRASEELKEEKCACRCIFRVNLTQTREAPQSPCHRASTVHH